MDKAEKYIEDLKDIKRKCEVGWIYYHIDHIAMVCPYVNEMIKTAENNKLISK